MAGVILFFGGIFNIVDPFFGLTIYQWFWIFVLFCSLCTHLLFRYGVWEKYKVLWGLYYAFKAQSNAAFIFNLKLVLELWSEAQAKCIFDYSKWNYEGFSENRFIAFFERLVFYYPTQFLDEDELNPLHAVIYKYGHRNMDKEIARKLQNEEWDEVSSLSITGTNTELILDGDNWTIRNSPQHKAIEGYAEIHNEANPKDQIHSYSKFQRYILDGTINFKEIPSLNLIIKPQVIIPWVRIDATFPISIRDNEEAGARRQQADDEQRTDKNSLNKYVLPVLIGGTGFAILIFIVRVIIFFMNAKPPA